MLIGAASNKATLLITLRQTSWVIFAIGIVAPAAWCWNQLDAFEQVHPAPACGMPILGLFGIAALAAAVFSLVAVGLGFFSYFRQPRPLKLIRILELAILSAPALAGLLLFLAITVL